MTESTQALRGSSHPGFFFLRAPLALARNCRGTKLHADITAPEIS